MHTRPQEAQRTSASSSPHLKKRGCVEDDFQKAPCSRILCSLIFWVIQKYCGNHPLLTEFYFEQPAGCLLESILWTAAAKSLQSCLTLCDPIDSSPPGAPVPGILQARTRVGCHFLLQCIKVKNERGRSVVSDPQQPHGLQPTKAPLSSGFSRQEYWSGLPLPSP